MKKFFKLGFAALLFAFVFMAFSGLRSAQADASDGSLEADLDGDGVDEIVEWTFDEEMGVISTLTINEASVYKAVKVGPMEAYSFTVSVIDTCTTDNYKELMVNREEEYYDFTLFRYDNGKITIYLDDSDLNGIYSIESQKKKGYIAINDYYTVAGIGNLHTSVLYKVKNGKAYIETKVFTPNENNYTTTFKTKVKLTVYKKDNCKEVAGTVKKGGKIKVTKFKRNGDSWLIYIKSGKLKGWVNPQDYAVDWFVKNPPLFQ